uniref:Uncharacterized protein n=1 Tax=Sphaerodactylus townsendi TaxID=933632 RepID=A0ACB8E7R3_9SAUR
MFRRAKGQKSCSTDRESSQVASLCLLLMQTANDRGGKWGDHFISHYYIPHHPCSPRDLCGGHIACENVLILKRGVLGTNSRRPVSGTERGGKAPSALVHPPCSRHTMPPQERVPSASHTLPAPLELRLWPVWSSG